MRVISIPIALILIAVLSTRSAAADVLVESRIDSVAMWIGEQTEIHLEVTCESGNKIYFPDLNDTVVSGLEIIPPVRTDTQYVNRKKRMVVTRHYTVTSFDSAHFYIPPFQILIDSVSYQSRNSLYLAVYMFDVDTLNKNNFFGPKEIINQPIKWQDIKVSLLYLFFVLLTAILAVFLYIRFKDDKPIVRIMRVEPKLPAHRKALDKIERIKEDKQAMRGDSKKFYTELTDALRQYIDERFGFFATEMTSSDIISRLLDHQDNQTISELSNLLTVADLVKFAKHKPFLNENDQNLLNAIEFVKNTMIESDINDSQPKEQKVFIESQRGKRSRVVLLSVIVITSLASIISLVLLVRNIYYLFF